MKLSFRIGTAILALCCIAPVWAQDVITAEAITSTRIFDKSSVVENQEPTPKADVYPDVPSVASNYAFATTTTGSLTNMSSGTTLLVAANQDDTASAVNSIGFDFFFQGARYAQFSANSNGLIRLGTTAVQGAGPYHPLAQAGLPLISAFGSDQRTHTSGKVHSKVIGVAPNRQLVVEFLNMQANFNSGGTADLTYQVRLSETSGQIEFVYAAMSMSATGAGSTDSKDPNIGFSSSNVVGTVGSVTAPQSGTPAPTFNSASATAFANTYTAGAIAALDSATDGSRRVFDFTPTAPTAPTALSFSAISPFAVTLNWVDSPDETLYAIFNSTDGVNYSFVSTAAQDATSVVASGLTPNTAYFWRVFAVSEGALSTPLAGTQATTPAGNVVSTGAGGNWSDPNTWIGNAVPASSDNVTIAGGATVTIDTAAVAYSVTVGNSATPATLQWDSAAARTLGVGTSVTISSSGTFATQGTGTITGHVLSLPGNLTNDGVLDFSTNSDTAGAGISFAGTNNSTFGGAGPTTDVRSITIAKSTLATTVELNPQNLTVQGVGTDVAGFVTLTSGTLKISGTFALTNRTFATAAYTIPAAAGFWLNNPNFVVAGQGASATVGGQFRVSQGTFNVGTATGNSMGFSSGSNIIIDGGSINAAGRFGVAAAANVFSYSQSAGMVTACTVGNTSTTLASFDLGTSTSSNIALSGGTIVLQLSNTAASGPRDYRNSAGSGIAGVTGGTLQLGNSGSGAAKSFQIGSVVPNLVIDNTSAGHSATFLAPVNYNDISLDITTKTGTTLNMVNGVFLFNGVTITNNGTLNATGVSSRFILFRANTANLYTGSGTVTAPMTSLELQDDIGLTIDPASPNIPVSRIIIFTGGFTHADKLTIGNGGTTTGIIQIGNTTTPTDAGTFDVAPIFNLGSGGQNISYLRTVLPRSTGPEVNPSRILTNLTFDDNDPTHTLTLAGGDLAVNATLALTNGRVITGANSLVANATASVTRTTGYVDGNFRKSYAAIASKTFEVGTANGYSPVVVNATAGTFPSDVTAKAVQSIAPGMSPADKAITRYWTLDAPGVTATLTFNYLDPLDIPVTVTEANLLLYRRDGSTFTDLGATLNTTANTALVAGVTTFGQFTLAEAGATVVEEADLSITKTDGVTSVNTGDSLTYTIFASNSGPTAVVGATVTDVLPSDLTCTWTCTGAGGGACTASGSGDISQSVNLPVGASTTFSVSCAVAAFSNNTSIVNTATIGTPVGISDPTPGNNTATDTDALVRLSDLSITKTNGTSSVISGGSTTYTIVVSNAGANDAAVTTTDMFPAALTGCTWTCTAFDGTCTSSGSGNITDAGAIDTGGTLTYTASCGVSVAASGSLINMASVALDGVSTADPNTANNSATDTDAIIGVYDVGVAITDNRDRVKLGDTLNYIITVGNPVGPSTASSQVSDILPAELSGGTWVCIPFGGASCSGGFGNVLSDNATLPAGSQVAYVYSVTVTSVSANDLISNTATVTTAGDSNSGNDSATDEDNLVIFADGFDGTPLSRPLDGFAGGSDFVQTALRVNPSLLGKLGIAPVAVAWGYSASGTEIFTLEIARFGSDTVARTSLVDSANTRQRSAWQSVDIANLPLELVWQTATATSADGYVVVAAGGTPIEMSGLSNKDRLTSLRVAVDHDSAWLLMSAQ